MQRSPTISITIYSKLFALIQSEQQACLAITMQHCARIAAHMPPWDWHSITLIQQKHWEFLQ